MYATLLIAQATDQLPAWERYLDKYGFSGLMLLGMLALLWKYAPGLIESQKKLTDAATAHMQDSGRMQQETATALKEHSSTLASINTSLALTADPKGDSRFREHLFSTFHTNKALVKLADAMLAAAEETSDQVANAVRPHVEAIKRVLDDAN